MNPQKKYKVVVFTSMNTKSLPDACHGVVRFTETHPEWDVTFSPGRSAKLLKQDAASADGVLVTRWPPETPRNILGPGKPMVFIDPDSHLKAAANLCEHMIDNTRIGTVAAQHLLSLRRYKSFAFATLDCRKSDKEPIFIRERHESFSAALRNKGVACTTIAPGQEAHILSALSKPVAVFAVTDERAAEFVREAHKLGLSIPRDLAILGVDNNTFQCESTTPSISSIDVDFTGSAIMACQKLDDLMHGKPVQSPSVYSGDIRLVARKSTAAPGPSGRLVTRALELVRARSKNGLTVQEVAHTLGVSRQLLVLRIREATGTTLHALIAEHRFDHASTLLRQTSKPIKNIVDECGFKSRTHFMAAFRRKFGKTPSSYRAHFQPDRQK